MDPQFICIVDPLSCWAVHFPLPAPPVSSCDNLLAGMCLVEPSSTGRIFGFSEFVQAFALLILVYTVSDTRSRFRVATAPFRFQILMFVASGTIGLGTLVTDFWFAKKLPTPISLSEQIYWQLAFGLIFLALVLAWLWYAFVHPPVFGRLNAYNFTRALFQRILQGDPTDLPIVAGELARSARTLVKFAPEFRPHWARDDENTPAPKFTRTQLYARDVLLLIANRRLCRHIAASSPGTAMALFQEMSKQEKYYLPISQFGVNVSTEAILNKDSILYHEDEGYYSGYFGYVKPFTQAIYGDHRLVEAQQSTPLDIRAYEFGGFNATQLEAYCRATLTTFADTIRRSNFYTHSFALARAFDTIEHSCSDLYKLNDENLSPEIRDDISRRVGVVMDFVNDAIKALDEQGVKRTTLRRHSEPYKWNENYYDHLAHIIVELIGDAALVKSKKFLTWNIQHNSIWAKIFGFQDSKTHRIIQFLVRRLLYAEIQSIERFPNFKNAAYLGYCLNISGLTLGSHKANDGEYVFRKAVIAWAKRNYIWLVKRNPKVAKTALIGKLSYDARNKRLIKTYEEGLRKKAPQEFLKLDSAPR
jgi:hypothetical protein